MRMKKQKTNVQIVEMFMTEGTPMNQMFVIEAINRYAESLPDDVKAELLACRNAGTANAVFRYRFCRCGTKKCGYNYLKDRICPPTAEQEQAADDEYWRVVEWQDRLLPVALGLGVAATGQLDLFEATA